MNPNPTMTMATVQAPLEQRLRLSHVSWDSYLKIGEELDQRPVHVTFDRGEMAIMKLSPEHENCKRNADVRQRLRFHLPSLQTTPCWHHH